VPSTNPRNHFGFCGGHWLCPGLHVARGALRSAVQTWLDLVPDFELAPGYVPSVWGNVRGSSNLALRDLMVQW